MKKYKVLNLAHEEVYKNAFKPLEKTACVANIIPERKKVLKIIGGFDACIASLKVRMDREVLDKAVKLKAIATPSTGTDHIDVKYAKEKGIEIISLKKDRKFLDNITATAEMAWALLLSAVRKLPWSFADAKKGRWARDKFRGHQLSGKTLGILGLGRLGTIVASYGRAFRMRVIACDVKKVKPVKGLRMVNFQTLLKQSDVISVHVHLTDENIDLIDSKAFSKMKKGAVLVNTSRGAVINERAFVKALKSGKLGAAGVDVIHGEWNKNLKDHPLIKYAGKHDNLVISPHTGGVTFESQAMALAFTAEKLMKFLKEL